MTAVVDLLLSIALLLGGLRSQAEYLVKPEKYNARTLVVTDLPAPVDTPTSDTFIGLSDVNMHYVVYGSGKAPLILVHGNGGSADSLREAARYLANNFTVYVPESRCHGQSSDPGVISYELMAKDLMEFCNALGLTKPVVMGHSDGAINAIQLAADYPDLPGAIIACGANSNPNTFKPYFPAAVKIKNAAKPDKLNDLMLTLPDFTEAYLAQITCPAYIVSGQFDLMWNSDTLYLAQNIPGSDFTVLRNEDHSSYMSRNGKEAFVLARGWLQEKGLWE